MSLSVHRGQTLNEAVFLEPKRNNRGACLGCCECAWLMTVEVVGVGLSLFLFCRF